MKVLAEQAVARKKTELQVHCLSADSVLLELPIMLSPPGDVAERLACLLCSSWQDPHALFMALYVSHHDSQSCTVPSDFSLRVSRL